MATFGVELGRDTVVLTRGRDFKWSFQNLDDSIPPAPVDFPAGDLYFEFDTGGEQNEIQQILIDKTTGGTYTLGFGGQTTSPINFDAVTVRPGGLEGSIQTALEGLSTIGAGNVIVHPVSLVPNWRIDLELNTGVDEVQQIIINGAVTSGSFVLSYNGHFTGQLAWDAAAADVQTALQGLSPIGSGNVSVTLPDDGSLGYIVQFTGALAQQDVKQIVAWGHGIGFNLKPVLKTSMTVTTLVKGSAKISESLVDILNQSMNDLFNMFDTLFGVTVDFTIVDDLNMTLTVTSTKSFDEVSVITFGVEVDSDLVVNFLNGTASWLGIFDTVQVYFYWTHTYSVEFVGALDLAPQPMIAVNGASLTGVVNTQSITNTEIQLGKPRFTIWDFTIDGDTASLSIPAVTADTMPARTNWQLVFVPDGESGSHPTLGLGGDPVTQGTVKTQGDDR